MPEFYIIIDQKIFSPNFRGATACMYAETAYFSGTAACNCCKMYIL